MAFAKIMKISGIDSLVESLLRSASTEPKTKKALNPIPEEDKPNLAYLMQQLSRMEDPIARRNANLLLRFMINEYKKKGIETALIEDEYGLRRLGLPYLRTQKREYLH